MLTKKEDIGRGLLIVSAIAALALVGFLPSLPQDLCYHQFSDADIRLGIPNFWNVVSNVPFLIVGGLGFRLFLRKGLTLEQLPYLLFFGGVAFVSLGSGYYHYHPDSDTLVWDRLPMTIAFMSLFSIMLSEFVSERWGKGLLWPLIGLGLLSIFYWTKTDDLRFYALIQFYPMLAMLIILLLFPSKYIYTSGYWWLFAFYILAKVFEAYDSQIHDTLSIVSGHPLKHIAAATGLFVLLKTYKLRTEKATVTQP